MTDDKFAPDPYPPHDADWRNERAACKLAVTDTLGAWSAPVQVAVLSELLSEAVAEQAEAQFVTGYPKHHADEGGAENVGDRQ